MDDDLTRYRVLQPWEDEDDHATCEFPWCSACSTTSTPCTLQNASNTAEHDVRHDHVSDEWRDALIQDTCTTRTRLLLKNMVHLFSSEDDFLVLPSLSLCADVVVEMFGRSDRGKRLASSGWGATRFRRNSHTRRARHFKAKHAGRS
jgi:hypothetical protein